VRVPAARAGRNPGQSAIAESTLSIWQVDLAVLGERCAGQAVASDAQLGHGDFCADSFRARTVVNDPPPRITLGDKNRNAGSFEEALCRLGDPMQRLLGIARGAGDGAKDFGAAGLAIPRSA
jgi:hypothetical protein